MTKARVLRLEAAAPQLLVFTCLPCPKGRYTTWMYAGYLHASRAFVSRKTVVSLGPKYVEQTPLMPTKSAFSHDLP